MSTFSVSVLIPVYNAGKFLAQCVESCVHLPEVAEVVLIEDASPDDSLSVCESLAARYEKVRLCRHPDGLNHGAGATRNVGLQVARYDFISFLDADDVFLPHRFEVTRRIFESQPDIFGVYEAIGVKFHDQVGKEQFCRMTNTPLAKAESYVTRLKVSDPDEVYQALITGRKGFFNTSGVTVKREVVRLGYRFNEGLRLHQDTEFWIRLSYNFRFAEGSIEPVSLRGVHSANRISRQNLQSKYIYYLALINYFRQKPVPWKIRLHLFRSLVRNHPKRKFLDKGNKLDKILELLRLSIVEIRNFPLGL